MCLPYFRHFCTPSRAKSSFTVTPLTMRTFFCTLLVSLTLFSTEAEAQSENDMTLYIGTSEMRNTSLGDIGYLGSPKLGIRGTSSLTEHLRLLGQVDVIVLRSDLFETEPTISPTLGLQLEEEISGSTSLRLSAKSGLYVGTPHNTSPKVLFSGDAGFILHSSVVFSAALDWLPHGDGLLQPGLTIGYRH